MTTEFVFNSQLNVIMRRIAAIQLTIEASGLPRPQILAANPYQPSDVSSIQCPFFVNEIRGGPSDLPIAAGQQYRTHNIQMMLAVARREANTNLKYNVQETAAWVDVVYAAFAAHIKLSAPAAKIVASTNANPIKITTGTPHGFTTGDQVAVSGHLVNTAANGTWNVTVIDYLNFTIPVAGNGTGGKTGQARLTQPEDLTFVSDSVITAYDLVPYAYGSTDENMPNFTALQFSLRVRELYVQTLSV